MSSEGLASASLVLSARKIIEGGRDALPRTPGVALFVDRDGGGKFIAGFGVDPMSIVSTPAGECLRVDVDASDDLAGFLKIVLGILKTPHKTFPGFREIVGVFEDGEEGVVIFLPAPRKAKGDGVEIEGRHVSAAAIS